MGARVACSGAQRRETQERLARAPSSDSNFLHNRSSIDHLVTPHQQLAVDLHIDLVYPLQATPLNINQFDGDSSTRKPFAPFPGTNIQQPWPATFRVEPSRGLHHHNLDNQLSDSALAPDAYRHVGSTLRRPLRHHHSWRNSRPTSRPR